MTESCASPKPLYLNPPPSQITKEYYNETALSKQAELEKLEVTEPGKSFATLFGKSPAAVKEDKIKKLKKEINDMSTAGEVRTLFSFKMHSNF